MKKSVIACLLLACMLVFVGCGEKEPEQTLSQRVADEVEFQISFQVMNTYEIVGTPTVTSYVNELENGFEVSGKVTVRDKYGDSYTGYYDALAFYHEDSDKISVETLEIGDLYRDN